VSESKQDRIQAAIRALPRGSVCSYGAVAAKAGMPGCARLVARAEGIQVIGGRVKMPKRGLDLDALLWAPD
jgi:6-O-methylguanine DNA methyltransferase, DNA binding domain